MRTAVQALSLLLFTLLFLFANYRLPDWLPADIYLRLDPLLGLSAILAGKEIVNRALWSLILIGATIVVGRFFCGYVCPLGAAIDFLDVLLFRKKARRELKADARLRPVKFALLIVFLSAALVGISLAYLLDPLALLTRFYTFVLYPLVITLLNLALDLVRPIFDVLGWVGLSHLNYTQPVYYMSFITALIFGGIIALNYYAPRFWCRYLCPLGALLGFISPLGRFKRRVGPECNACEECRIACPMGAPGEVAEKIQLSECIQCRTCVEACHQKTISFAAFPSPDQGGEYSPINVSRRGFLYSASGGLSVAFLADRTPFTQLRGKRQLIRPPGALPEAEFMRTCVRCAECMKSCPTNTLQPCLWESGLTGLWTPKMDLRFAACELHCNVCGKVCPTQAIRSLSLDEKTHAKVGTAIINRDLCLVWAQDKLCLICDEICPYNAIVFRTIEGYRRPVVIASRCNGCGFCEQRCPVQGESAIIVMTNGEIRLKEGSYIEEAKKLQLEFKPDSGDDRFILEEYELKAEDSRSSEKGTIPRGVPAPKKPQGFLE